MAPPAAAVSPASEQHIESALAFIVSRSLVHILFWCNGSYDLQRKRSLICLAFLSCFAQRICPLWARTVAAQQSHHVR